MGGTGQAVCERERRDGVSKKYDPLNDVITGLQIFRENGGTQCGAEHDVFYAAQKNGKALTQAEVKALQKHGWFPMGELCGGCADDDSSKDETFSDPDDSETRHLLTCTAWAKFV